MQRLHYDNVHVKVGDGYHGWPEHAPFDKIIVTCSPEKAPPELVAELKEGGRMIIPVGQRYQQTLYLLKKSRGKMVSEALLPTLFVPMTGTAEEARSQPDPANPTMRNGGFRQVVGNAPIPSQLSAADGSSKSGRRRDYAESNYVLFKNPLPRSQPPSPARFRRQIGETMPLAVAACQFHGEGLHAGQNRRRIPRAFFVTFYDERQIGGEAGLGPWQEQPFRLANRNQADQHAILKAHKANIVIGLFGAVGEL